jgi:hypothetical protein
LLKKAPDPLFSSSCYTPGKAGEGSGSLDWHEVELLSFFEESFRLPRKKKDGQADNNMVLLKGQSQNLNLL